jgi:spermidine synthase
MRLLLVLFFCSGACGLAYQVLWMRLLSNVFGVTAYAASTVLAAFMAGLALGSWLAGPLLRRISRPLRAFGMAEIAIGLAAISTPAALDLASSIYRSLYAAVPDAFWLQTAARFVCAFLVLSVPTLLMGLTLPLVAASPLVSGDRAPARIGALYAVNTAGAVSGTLLTGFVLIGAIGMRRTFLAAAVLNSVVGILAIALDFWLGRRQVSRVLDAQDFTNAGSTHPEGAVPSRLIWGIMAASGFGALALEVVWFRMMTQFVDATTYAFSGMLAVVLVGIATGGAVASRLMIRDRDWRGWLGWTQVLTGVLVLLGIEFIVQVQAPWLTGSGRVLIAVLLPSLVMGFSFPLLVKLGVPSSTIEESPSQNALRGRMLGRFYGMNVIGGILGSLFGGFLMLPAFGTRATLVALASIFVVAGVSLWYTDPNRPRIALPTATAVGLFVLLALMAPDPLSAARVVRKGTSPASEIFRDEGVQTTVSVLSTDRERTLVVGGLHQANDGDQMVRLHRSIGMLPMALHPNPARALVIGLGGGATAGAVSQHDGTSVQIVELSDGVRKAAPFFARATYDVLRQPNVRMRVDDGRNFLLLSGEKFDVITADIIQPIHAGAGGLYSREYFELVRRSLNPGGLVLQWIGKRERTHYTLIMRTFLEVFPDATLWVNGGFMVGSLEPLKLDKEKFEAKLALPRTGAALVAVGLDSYEALRRWYTAGPKEMARFVGPGLILTDDRPLLEYHRSLKPDPVPLDIRRLNGDLRDVEIK